MLLSTNYISSPSLLVHLVGVELRRAGAVVVNFRRKMLLQLIQKELPQLHNVFGTRPYSRDSPSDMRVYIDQLHRAPPGNVDVYRPLDLNRIQQVVGQKRTMPAFHAALQHLVASAAIKSSASNGRSR